MADVLSLFQFFDSEKMQKKYAIDPLLASLAYLPADEVRRALRPYRFFTHHYIDDLALLISKMPFGTLRSLLADFLNEELGSRNPEASHPALYDRFLLGLGCRPEELAQRSEWVCAPLSAISEQIQRADWLTGLGMRGLGGECLCQVYLECAYGFLRQNPHLDLASVDTRFWEIHAGAIDQEHRRSTLAAVAELFASDPSAEASVRSAFHRSDQAWDEFWQRAFRAARLPNQKAGDPA